MVSKAEACVQCTRKCRIMHKMDKDPSVITSFFKVMISRKYSEVLFLPKRFARKSPVLAGQETQLEDSSGQQWKVTLCEVDGSLAFQKGWHKFATDHELKVGDLVLFHYIMDSHFVVQIYGPSACPENRLVGTNRNQKIRMEGKDRSLHKKSESNYQSVSYNRSCSANGSSACQFIPSSTPEPFVNGSGAPTDTKSPCTAEPFCMFDRDSGYVQGDYSRCVLDLSALETPKILYGDDACGRNCIAVEGKKSAQ